MLQFDRQDLGTRRVDAEQATAFLLTREDNLEPPPGSVGRAWLATGIDATNLSMEEYAPTGDVTHVAQRRALG